MKYRGLIHFHSQYSYDSILSIKDIVKFAVNNDINFLILTDHDTTEGSIALKNYIDKNNLGIEVLIAAEYYTEYGDIIALDIQDETRDLQFDNFIKEVKKQGGLLLLPHPYKGHKNIDYIARNVDMIEVFNSRTDDAKNKKAQELAAKYKKNAYMASDAHNYRSLKKCIIELEKKGNLKESLLQSPILPVSMRKTYLVEIILSQFIKSYKTKDIKLCFRQLKSIIKSIINLQFFKQV